MSPYIVAVVQTEAPTERWIGPFPSLEAAQGWVDQHHRRPTTWQRCVIAPLEAPDLVASLRRKP